MSTDPVNSTTTSGAGADDQPTSRLLSDLALWLCRLQSRGPLSGSVFAAQVSPMLEAAFERAADFRDIEAAQREADQRVTAQLDQLYTSRAPLNRRERRHPELIGLQEAADYCDVSYRTVRRWIADGRINAVRVGPRLLKVDADELAAFLQPTGGAA